MAIDFLYPQSEVIRNPQRCISCRACERQCANEVHHYDVDFGCMMSDESKCVACHRCVSLCPTRALKIVKTDHTFKENANWTGKAISEVYRQAGTGGVLLLDKAKEVLETEFPELAKKIELNIPDENSRRVGQSVAAASLPAITAG